MDLAEMRVEYETAGLVEKDLDPDPITQFETWMSQAVKADVIEPNAMVLSTVDSDGQPWARHVLLKGVSKEGFDFFTNYESLKSQQLETNPKACLTFPWLELHRQVIITGTAQHTTSEESVNYWERRTRTSQLGSAASSQSQLLENRQDLEERFGELNRNYETVPRPEHWGGWRIKPRTIEFWQGRADRLHDRFRYTVNSEQGWVINRLWP